mgnify:CR=1 FL=1
MHTVLGIDLKPGSGWFFHDFVDARWAVSLRGLGVFGEVNGNRNTRVAQCQMTWLILLMIGIGQKHRRETIKGQLVIGLGVVDRLKVIDHPGFGRVGQRVGKRPWLPTCSNSWACDRAGEVRQAEVHEFGERTDDDVGVHGGAELNGLATITTAPSAAAMKSHAGRS